MLNLLPDVAVFLGGRHLQTRFELDEKADQSGRNAVYYEYFMKSNAIRFNN